MTGFSIGISEITRHEDVVEITLVLTKENDDKPSDKEATGTLVITLEDDHGNAYSGELAVDLNGAPGKAARIVPVGFTYADSIKIDMPIGAPVESLRIGEDIEILPSDLLLAPRSEPNFSISEAPPQMLSLGEYVTISVNNPKGGLIGWTLPIEVNNRDYNPLPLEVRLGLQFRDASIAWVVSHTAAATIPGSDQALLDPQLLTLTEAFSRSDIRAIVIYVTDQVGSQGWVKVFSVTPDEFEAMPERFVYDHSRTYASGRVFVATLDGSEIHRITVYGSGPDFLPDGTMLVYEDGHSGNLHYVRADGEMIETVHGGMRRHLSPVVSPDGERIAFILVDSYGNKTIGTAKLDLTDIVPTYTFRIDSSGRYCPRYSCPWGNPSWSADSALLALDDGQKSYMTRADGSERVDLGTGILPVWSPIESALVSY